LTTQRQIEAWKPVVEAIRKEGAVSIMQMFHCGRMAWPEINPANRVIAPSAISPRQKNFLTGEPYTVPDEMSAFDIHHVINGFVETAKGAVKAGFDGIEALFPQLPNIELAIVGEPTQMNLAIAEKGLLIKPGRNIS